MKNLLVMCSAILFAAISNAQTQTKEEMKDYSTEIIRYTIVADKHKDFEKAYAEAGKHLSKSAYCLSYQILHGEEEPDNYIVIIKWTSVDDHLNGFRKSTEFMEFFKLVKPFYNNIQEMKHYKLTDISWQK